MPAIVSVSSEIPPYKMTQNETKELVYQLFSPRFPQINRLIKVFETSDIQERNFMVPKTWFDDSHPFSEKNAEYVKAAINLGKNAILSCLEKAPSSKIDEIDAIFFITSSGIATPTIDARIMNTLPFSIHTKRIPIWGLGCAGGAAGISRAYDYCLAYPHANVLVLSVEFCSLTFSRDDMSKSNFIGTSLFGDGVACALVAGDQAIKHIADPKENLLHIRGTQSTFMHESENIMGWDLQDDGLHVIFSRDIPTVIEEWLKPNVDMFLSTHGKSLNDIDFFVAHPGGKKVLQAYEKALNFSEKMTEIPRNVLKYHGNMSSPTVLYVLKEVIERGGTLGEKGIMTALGPGFCSELLLLEWAEIV